MNKKTVATVKCHAQCGFSEDSDKCEFCEYNEERKVLGDEEAWEKWYEKAIKLLGHEPTTRQAFRAAWVIRGRKKNGQKTDPNSTSNKNDA